VADNYDSGETTPSAETPTEAPAAEQGQSDEKILALALERFKLTEEAEQETRVKHLETLKFRTGQQWDPVVEAQRRADRRPCLTINKLPQHVQQVTNDQRQNRPAIKVHAVDDTTDPETAKVINGIIRHIEKSSSADFAYDTAFEGTVGDGLGYFRALTEYADPMSFDQEIRIKRIRDRFSVFFDPYSQEPDGSDSNFAFIVADMAPDEFRAQYPDAKLSQTGQWDVVGLQQPDWVRSDNARIAEYFCKEFKKEPIVLLSDGRVVKKSELPKPPAALPPGLSVVDERVARVPTIYWYKINACEILERRTLPGFWIPVIPVYGTEHIVEGKRILKGIVADAMDSQRVYNVMKSAEMEAIGLAPKAPFVAEEGQLEGYENDWDTANSRNHAYLKYKAVSVNGTPLPPPQRMAFEPAVMAITNAAMGAGEDIKSTTGIYDASLGARSNETSGIAIQRRNLQAQTSTFHYIDNLSRSIKHLGRILVAWIPEIYDSKRVLRILGDEDQERIVTINAPFVENGEQRIYDLSVGRYDVTVDVGPSFASKRQEAAQSMMEFSKAVPAAAALTADLIAKHQDWPGAQEFSDRLRKGLPPGIADDPKGGKPIPPEVQAQIAQGQQLIEQLQGQLAAFQSEREQKLLELESKERIEMAKLETQAAIKLAELESGEALLQLKLQTAQLEQRQRLLGSGQPLPGGSQDFTPEPDGAMSADVGLEGDPNPTGGEAPGTPMEQSNEDPNAY
jgi:hypothetical protein